MIQSTHSKDELTVTIDGTFNFSCFQEFQRALGDKPVKAFVIDLRRTEYLDSAALGMLLLVRERAGNDPTRVKLLLGPGQPTEVLKLAHFSSLFTMA